LARYPTRSELWKDRLQEQACAAAVATKKTSELQDEVQDLKERLANEVAEREYDKEKSRQLMEQQLEATRNEMRKEFLAMLAQWKEATSQQVILFENVRRNFFFYTIYHR
jgi:ABC-type transporter MlaC component